MTKESLAVGGCNEAGCMDGGHGGHQRSRQQCWFSTQPSARPQQQQPVERRSLIMSLGQMDPALVCSGPMSNLSYDSHIVTRCLCST